ncbi:MAG TPA: methyltransferase domain-containing protein [Planctomycetota bacterium]|nr:methyltransferase domain-containing protein [Planctomycetota bacterium]
MTARTTPADLAIDETLAFVNAALGRKRRRILEVGCGDGALARRLVALGHDVVGIDRSEKAVEKARAAGFAAELGDFLEYEAEPFDAVAFTRSLHHIHDLRKALARARALLAPGGTLVIDDFALESMDRKTAAWLGDQRAVLGAAGILHHHGHGTDPLASWKKEHEHDPPLHPGKALVAATRRVFGPSKAERGPYLYRYFCLGLEQTARGAAVASAILDVETRLVAEGSLVPIGLRILATRRRAK